MLLLQPGDLGGRERQRRDSPSAGPRHSSSASRSAAAALGLAGRERLAALRDPLLEERGVELAGSTRSR